MSSLDQATTANPQRPPARIHPTVEDPIDPAFDMRLYSTRDDGDDDAFAPHIPIRRDLLEVRRTMSGRVFFRCACCKHLPRDERAKLSVLAPQNVGNLYRAVSRYMMHHVRECEHVPQNFKDVNPRCVMRNVKGAKECWAKSAMSMGLRDGVGGKSIVYCAPVTQSRL